MSDPTFIPEAWVPDNYELRFTINPSLIRSVIANDPGAIGFIATTAIDQIRKAVENRYPDGYPESA